MVAIIRPKGSLTGTDRMAQLLKKDIFKPFYGEGTEHADAEALSAARIQVIDGDLSDVPELPTDLDIVVHCAGDVASTRRSTRRSRPTCSAPRACSSGS